MGYVIDLMNYFATHPLILVTLFLLYLLIFSLSIIWSARKPGANPFKHDMINPSNPLVTDCNVRDKVLKVGFQSKLVPDKLDAIVIGSGIGGLATAALLSKAGKKVLVLEQHDQAGGCCHTFTENGFEFDVGIHYIGNMNENSKNKFLLDQISCGQIQWEKLDNEIDLVTIGSEANNRKQVRICVGDYTSFSSSLKEQFPVEKEAIDKYIELLKKADKNLKVMVLFKILPKWLVGFLVKTRLIYAVSSYFSLARKSLDEVLNGITKDRDLKAILSYNYADYGVEPARSSFMLHAILQNHYMNGAFYPKGGASELAFHIIPVIENAGGKVLVRAKVKEILVENGKAVGVRLDKAGVSTDLRAPLVISDAGFLNTFDRLLPREIAEKSEVCRLLRNRIDSGASALSVFVGLKGSSDELGLKKHNIWMLANNDLSTTLRSYLEKSLDDVSESDVPLIFISSPSARDPSYEVRHPGKSAITVIVPANWAWFESWQNEKVKNRGKEYKARKKCFMLKIWKHVLSIYPHLDDKVEYLDMGTGVSNNFYLNSIKGEIYGLDHSKERFSDPDVLTHLRPETGLPGLLLTGQDVLACGLMGALCGAMITSSVALKRNLYADVDRLLKESEDKKRGDDSKKEK